MIRNLIKKCFTQTLKDLEQEGKIIKLNKVQKSPKLDSLNPIPASPILGPIKIENPVISNKTYRWCSCGLSQKQPFCDQSHKGTAFKPFRFTLEENTKELKLCGCKFTKNVPFCDGETCHKLQKQIEQ